MEKLSKENEKKAITSKFMEIYSKIDRENPSEQSLKDIQACVAEAQSAPTPLKSLSQNLTLTMIQKTFGAAGANVDHLLKGAEEMRAEMGYGGSTTIEQLLIDEIILEFYRTQAMQRLLTELTMTKGTALRTIKKIDDLASSAQNRFHKSIQMLAKIRKSGVKLQINIATSWAALDPKRLDALLGQVSSASSLDEAKDK
jgi:hypothetical protein